ncbi:MAG: aldo/keto reductase [Cyanobacteria bacterium J06648_10]
MKSITLRDGNTMPIFGLGTWKSPKGEVREAVKEAIRVGYRHIDAAWIYQNEQEVGEGIRAGLQAAGINRDELFVTSKLWNTFHAPQDVKKGCQETLKALGLDYLDLYLIHWPVAFKPDIAQHKNKEDFWSMDEMPLADTFSAMLQLREQGLVKSVGVSNCGTTNLKKLSNCDDSPAMNQIELHPYNPQPELLDYCQAQGIAITAYSPLGSGDRPDSMKQKGEPPLLENEVVNEVARQENITPAQLLIAWAIDRETVVIPKSTNPGRIAENLEAASHSLSAKARTALDNIDIQYRYVGPESWFYPGITYEGDSFWA